MAAATHVNSESEGDRHRPAVGSDGVPLTLTHPEVKTKVEGFVKELVNDPEKARAYLVELGTITKGGKLTKSYGG